MLRGPLGLATALRSADAFEKVAWCDAEPVSERDDGGQTWLSPGSFEQRHLGAVQAAVETKGLLAKPGAVTWGNRTQHCFRNSQSASLATKFPSHRRLYAG